MSLGHYLWKNLNPDQPGFGEEFDIDVDKLPTTSNPPNVTLPNVHIDDDRYIMRCLVPNFYMSPEGELYHSTHYND